MFKKIAILCFIGFALMAINRNTNWLSPMNSFADNVGIPFRYVSNIPSDLLGWFSNITVKRSDLESDNTQLIRENLIYKGKLQRMGELQAENIRLRLLLNATELLMDEILVTEVIGVPVTSKIHTLIINRGFEDGVYVGQPVLDSEGLMGQVMRVHKNFSTVLLITDSTHAIPVQILRTGMRSTAEGISDFKTMTLRFISPTSDIKVGDQLVSSGLGGRFPSGYPVGIVTAINHKLGANFVRVEVTPSAHINKSKHLLLVFNATKKRL